MRDTLIDLSQISFEPFKIFFNDSTINGDITAKIYELT